MLAWVTLFLECTVLMFLKNVGVDCGSEVLSVLLIVIFTLAYFISLSRSKRMLTMRTPLMLGYLIRLLLLFFDLYGRSIYLLPNSGADSEVFFQKALIAMQNGTMATSSAFVAVTGTLFTMLGMSRLFVQFLLMLCSVAALHLTYKILETVNIPIARQKQTMTILCTLPNFAILSSIFLRESVVTLCVTISLYFFVRWYLSRRELWFLMAFVCAFCASRFHSGTVAVAAGYIAVRLLFDSKTGSMRLSFQGLFSAAFFLFVFVYLYNNYADKLFGKMVNIDSLEDISSGRGLGGSNYAAYVGNSSSPLNMLIYTPLRIFYFLFSPLPWQWRGLNDIIAFCFSSMFYLLVVVQAFASLKRVQPEYRTLILLLLVVAFCALFVFAWGVTNTGTATRHREKMAAIYAVLLGLANVRIGNPKALDVQFTHRD